MVALSVLVPLILTFRGVPAVPGKYCSPHTLTTNAYLICLLQGGQPLTGTNPAYVNE